MEYNKAVEDMQFGDRVEGYYVLSSIQQRTLASGGTLFCARLSDATGSIAACIRSGGVSEADAGSVVWVRGEVGEYRGATQFGVQSIRVADKWDEYDLRALAPSAPLDTADAMAELRELVSSIQDADYRRVCEAMLERHGDLFQDIPAAKSIHHAFLSGLLMHTLNMLRMADLLSGLYGEIIDRSLLMTGTLLHDFGKLREFVRSPLGLVKDYAVEGSLLGHPYMGAQEVCEVASALGTPAEKAMLLQHLLLSHHGQPEFGAAVVPQCAEAELLNSLDHIDSRMEIYAETLCRVPEGSFSRKLPFMDKALYRHR